jgi:hypothetical protein
MRCVRRQNRSPVCVARRVAGWLGTMIGKIFLVFNVGRLVKSE